MCRRHGESQCCRPRMMESRRHTRLTALAVTAAISVMSGCGQQQETTSSPNEEIIVVSDPVEPTQPQQDTPSAIAEPKSHPDQTPADSQPAGPTATSPAESVSGPRLRLADDRPDMNEQRLQTAGIRVERSRRLVLLTDLPAADTVGLCDLADALFRKLEQDLGSLPDAADGSEFQVTGHLIGDPQRFASIGLMPNAGLTFRHGRHVNYQFWMNAPDTAYYRRHLLLHEFTHCFMTCESGMTDIPPLWYIEGMAEYFATHQIHVDGSVRFGVMPTAFTGFEGWGRISELRKVARLDDGGLTSQASPQILSLSHVLREVVTLQDDVDYAWWWAACWMLQNHPRYASDFAVLRSHQHRAPFLEASRRFLQQHEDTMPSDWLLFIESLESGFDAETEFQTAEVPPWQLQPDASRRITLDARRGWIPTGLTLSAGERVRIQASGQYAMNEPAEDWKCEPQGVSIEYVRNVPLGALVATVVSPVDTRVRRRFVVGTDRVLTAEFAGTVWLQVVDHSAERFNNSGSLSVSFSASD